MWPYLYCCLVIAAVRALFRKMKTISSYSHKLRDLQRNHSVILLSQHKAARMLISAFLDVADNGGERKKKNTLTPFPV
jgi:hypothetical protein